MEELMPCPFCGSADIRYSVKLAFHRGNKKQHRIAMYCWNCNCYGARTVIDTSGRNRYEVEQDLRIEDIAAEAWNRRKGKTGHWKAFPDEYQICGTEFVCSNCNESFVNSELASDNGFLEMMKYCPNCGAKMDAKDFVAVDLESYE